MSEERLINMAILFRKSGLRKSIDCEWIINKFAILKARKNNLNIFIEF